MNSARLARLRDRRSEVYMSARREKILRRAEEREARRLLDRARSRRKKTTKE